MSDGTLLKINLDTPLALTGGTLGFIRPLLRAWDIFGGCVLTDNDGSTNHQPHFT